LESIFGKDKLEKLQAYLHEYTGTAESVKPVAKHVTIYWIGRLGAEAILRTEGEDDIILTRIRDKAVPTLIFRKFKATMLRAYMETMRVLWAKYRDIVVAEVLGNYKNLYGDSYNFLTCGISPGIEGSGKAKRGVMQQRCMKCPVDVLMGAVSGKEVDYNLASRLVGDPAYATTDTYRRRTGNAVDEITYTTGMGKKAGETGALYTETIVEPGTLFVGKMVLFMPSPVELVYMLGLLVRVHRYGARKSIMGSMEIYPVVAVADYYETGTAYAIARKVLGKTDIDDIVCEICKYVRGEATSSAIIADLKDVRGKIVKLNLDDEELYVEAWKNAANYVKGIKDYLKR